jgi:hypothetical protein
VLNDVDEKNRSSELFPHHEKCCGEWFEDLFVYRLIELDHFREHACFDHGGNYYQNP